MMKGIDSIVTTGFTKLDTRPRITPTPSSVGQYSASPPGSVNRMPGTSQAATPTASVLVDQPDQEPHAARA